MLKAKVSEGRRRLRWVVSASSVVVTYILLCVNERRVSDDEAFFEFPLLSVLAGIGVFVSMTAIYWVDEGFRKDN